MQRESIELVDAVRITRTVQLEVYEPSTGTWRVVETTPARLEQLLEQGLEWLRCSTTVADVT